MESKRQTCIGETPTNEQVVFIREVGRELLAKAPAYLRLPAQQLLLITAADGRATLEVAVS